MQGLPIDLGLDVFWISAVGEGHSMPDSPEQCVSWDFAADVIREAKKLERPVEDRANGCRCLALRLE